MQVWKAYNIPYNNWFCKTCTGNENIHVSTSHTTITLKSLFHRQEIVINLSTLEIFEDRHCHTWYFVTSVFLFLDQQKFSV